MSKILEQDWGTVNVSMPVKLYTLYNSNGMQVCITDYGAIVTSIFIPVKNKLYDVTLGFDTVQDYVTSRQLPVFPYFGAVIGRYAGRIKDGEFTLNGRKFLLPKNNGNHTLHGGINGFDAVVWNLDNKNDTNNSLTFSYTSKDGEEGFPGELTVSVQYSLTENNELQIEYQASTSEDTIINLTQHSYFNLDGHTESIDEQTLQLFTDRLLEIDKENIPSGNIINASAKGFNFTNERICPVGIDDSFIIADSRLPAAILKSKRTGITLTVYTDQPSIHIYTGGDCFGKLLGKTGAKYHARSGICFETQHYPDSPNRPEFPTTFLKREDTYHQKTVWKFTVQ